MRCAIGYDVICDAWAPPSLRTHQMNTCDLFSRNKAYKMFFTQFAKMRCSNVVIVLNSHFFLFSSFLQSPGSGAAHCTAQNATTAYCCKCAFFVRLDAAMVLAGWLMVSVPNRYKRAECCLRQMSARLLAGTARRRRLDVF